MMMSDIVWPRTIYPNDPTLGHCVRVFYRSLFLTAWAAALEGMESEKLRSIPGSTPLTGEGWKLVEYLHHLSRILMQFMPRLIIYNDLNGFPNVFTTGQMFAFWVITESNVA